MTQNYNNRNADNSLRSTATKAAQLKLKTLFTKAFGIIITASIISIDIWVTFVDI